MYKPNKYFSTRQRNWLRNLSFFSFQ